MKTFFKFSLIFILIGLSQCQEPMQCLIADFTPSIDCSGFIRCSNGIYSLQLCPGNLLFDVNNENCNWASAVSCDNTPLTTIKMSTTTTSQTNTTSTTPITSLSPTISIDTTNADIISTKTSIMDLMDFIQELINEMKIRNTPVQTFKLVPKPINLDKPVSSVEAINKNDFAEKNKETLNKIKDLDKLRKNSEKRSTQELVREMDLDPGYAFENWKDGKIIPQHHYPNTILSNYQIRELQNNLKKL